MTSGASKNKVTALAIEGPSWAGAEELYEYLLNLFHRKHCWTGVPLPYISKTNMVEVYEYARDISTGPRNKVIYRNHLIPLIACLHSDDDKINTECLEDFDNFLYAVVLPKTTIASVAWLYKNCGLNITTINNISRVYEEATKVSNLNHIMIKVDKTNSSWKVGALIAIRKEMGIK